MDPLPANLVTRSGIPRRAFFVVIACLLTVGAMLASGLLGAGFGVGSERRKPRSAEGEGVSALHVQRLFAEVAANLDSERSLAGNVGTSQAVSSVREPATRASNDEWEALRRSDVSLARLMLTGAYGEEMLVRHRLLNLSDVPLPPGDRADLRALVDRLQANSRGFRQELAAMRLQDRAAKLKESPGSVPEVQETAADGDQKVGKLQEFYASRGELVSLDEARLRIGRGEAFAVTLTGESSAVDGKVYRNRDFASLPRSDALLDKLRYIASGELAVLVAWFWARGYGADSPELLQQFRLIESLPPNELGI